MPFNQVSPGLKDRKILQAFPLWGLLPGGGFRHLHLPQVQVYAPAGLLNHRRCTFLEIVAWRCGFLKGGRPFPPSSPFPKNGEGGNDAKEDYLENALAWPIIFKDCCLAARFLKGGRPFPPLSPFPKNGEGGNEAKEENYLEKALAWPIIFRDCCLAAGFFKVGRPFPPSSPFPKNGEGGNEAKKEDYLEKALAWPIIFRDYCLAVRLSQGRELREGPFPLYPPSPKMGKGETKRKEDYLEKALAWPVIPLSLRQISTSR